MPELTDTQWLIVLMGATVVMLVGIFAVVTYAVASGGVGSSEVGDGDDTPHPTIAWLQKEPAMVAGVIMAAASVGVALGFNVSGELIAAMTGLISIVLAIAVRQSVYAPETIARSGLSFDPKDGKLKRGGR